MDKEEVLKQSKKDKKKGGRDRGGSFDGGNSSRGAAQAGPLTDLTPEQARVKAAQQLALQAEQRRTLLAARQQQLDAAQASGGGGGAGGAAQAQQPPQPGSGQAHHHAPQPSGIHAGWGPVAGSGGGGGSGSGGGGPLSGAQFPGLPTASSPSPRDPPPSSSSGSGHGGSSSVDRKSLQNIRVVQRNLIYVIGLPPHIASEEVLRRAEYFGQYGKIMKVVVNRNHTGVDGGGSGGGNGGGGVGSGSGSGLSSQPAASAYITFAHKEDAKACIGAVDGLTLDQGRTLRASFGTTK